MQQSLQTSASQFASPSAPRTPSQAADRLLASLGLGFNPFSIAINQGSYYETAATRKIMDVILYGAETRKGFLLLNGEVGVGKSSLLLRLLVRLKNRGMVTALVINSLLDKQELLENICADFGLKHRPGLNTSQLLMVLHTFFLQQFKHGRNCVILVDEAHHLGDEALESLRMLANLETGGVKLVQIVLSGQPELRQRLQTRRLRQFASRINIAADLPALTKPETGGYVEFKLAQAGSQIRPSAKALDLLWQASAGNPRLVNLLMERCLYAMVARGRDVIDVRIMHAAIADLRQCQGDLVRPLHASRTWTWGRTGLKTTIFALGVAALLAAALVLGWLLGQGGLYREAMRSVTITAPVLFPEQEANAVQVPPGAAEGEHVVTAGILRRMDAAVEKADAVKGIGLDVCVLRHVADQGPFYTLELGRGLPREQAQALRNHFQQYFSDTVFMERVSADNSSRDAVYCPR